MLILLEHSQCDQCRGYNARTAAVRSRVRIDRTLKLWDLRTGDLIRSFVGHTDADSRGGGGPDDRHALSGSADRTLRLWDIETGRAPAFLHGARRTRDHGCDLPRRAPCASRARDDRTLRLWDLEQRICRAIVPLDSSPQAIALAPDGQTSWSEIELATSITSRFISDEFVVHATIHS